MNTIKMNFKGDGSYPSGKEAVEWEEGFKAGRAYTVQYYTLGSGVKLVFPDFLNNQSGHYLNGWVEGTTTGTSDVFKRDYPGYNSISLSKCRSYYEVRFTDSPIIKHVACVRKKS